MERMRRGARAGRAAGGVVAGVVGLAMLGVAGPCVAQVQEQRLTPADPLTSDIFGYDVAFDGATIVAGAPFATFSGVSQPGRLFVFERGPSSWVQTKKLLTPTLIASSGFGAELAVDGDVIVAGAIGVASDSVANAGRVYVFERTGGVWGFKQEFGSPDPVPTGNFGVAVAVHGDEMLIGSNGATQDGMQFAGAVYVYRRVSGAWTYAQTIYSPDPAVGDVFGASVAFEGDTAVIGGLDDDHDGKVDPGSAYIFHKTDGLWAFEAKLTASDPGEASYFGGTVAIGDGTVVVGAERHDVNGLNEAGAAYVYANGSGGWAQTARLIAPVPDPSDRFGCDVAVRGQTIIVGSHLASVSGKTGAAHVFRQVSGAWVFDRTLTASDTGNTNFGWRVAMAGDRAAIAGPFYQTNRGAVYMFNSVHACRADLNGDGVVDFADYLDFLNRYDAQDLSADLTGDGVVDFGDYLEFLNLYDQGC